MNRYDHALARRLSSASMPIKTENKAAFSSMAAALGSRGGKASKRKPGKLRCILLEICNELGSQENHAVFRYWQVHSMAATADNSSGDTCWFKYSLHAKPRRNYDHWLDKRDPYDGDYIYHYFDGNSEKITSAHTLRSTLYRIRCTDNRFTAISACQDEL